MPSSPSRSDENPPRGVSPPCVHDSSTSFTAPGSHPFHFYPPPQHHPHPGRWSAVSTAPDAVPPTYNPAVHTTAIRLTEYPLGPWTVSFPPSGPHPPSSPTQTHTQVQGFDAGRGEAYYPTAYNIDTFPFVPHPQPSLHHAYPHAYSQARHQMAPPSPSRPPQTQRRDVFYSVLQGNESPASQPPQRHHQRTDPQQSIIHQRTQELLAQTNLSPSLSTDRQATAEYGVARGNGGVAMLSGNSENGAGSSSTVQVGPDHVGLPFLLGSVDEVLYGVSPPIGEVMGKPNTGAVTGTTSTTHVGDMTNTRISQDPTSASTSALERHGHNLAPEPRVPSTRPPSPPGGFVGCTLPGNMQPPTVTEGGPDSGSGSSLPTHPQSHAESQSSHTHSQNLHINPQSSHTHSYIHTHPSYIHPRSHSSLSPASYASYPPTGSSIEYSTGSSIEYSTGEYSTTGSSASEYPTATSSVDEYPTTGGYPPGTSLVQQYHPTTSSVGEYPTVQERSASAPGSAPVSGSLSRQDGNTGGATRRYGAGYGHGHSESVSTVRGSSMSSSRQHYEYGEYSISAVPPTPSRQDEHAGGQAHGLNPSQHAGASPGSVRPTILGGVHSQKQQRRGRKAHQYPTRRVRGNQPEQSSEPYAALMTRPNASAQGEKSQGQSLGKARALESTSSRTRGGGATRDAPTTIGKRPRPPKRLRPGSPATAVLTRGGGGDSDDDSDDEGDGERPATGPGGSGPSGGPEVGGTGGGQGNTSGGIGPRKAGACSHCKHLKVCERFTLCVLGRCLP
ncbi:hypothetical protein EV401DRAFT_735176 [Pisolithus croceorrhizus]|nr:hypothetical protein EV401DRAFT_735176 [Pisolithus croceorrhizus]